MTMAVALGWSVPDYWRSTPLELRLAFDGWRHVNGVKDRPTLDQARAIRDEGMALFKQFDEMAKGSK